MWRFFDTPTAARETDASTHLARHSDSKRIRLRFLDFLDLI